MRIKVSKDKTYTQSDWIELRDKLLSDVSCFEIKVNALFKNNGLLLEDNFSDKETKTLKKAHTCIKNRVKIIYQARKTVFVNFASVNKSLHN